MEPEPQQRSPFAHFVSLDLQVLTAFHGCLVSCQFIIEGAPNSSKDEEGNQDSTQSASQFPTQNGGLPHLALSSLSSLVLAQV